MQPVQMLPAVLRAEIRQAIIEWRVERADLLRWVPQMNARALAEFIETGRVTNDRMLIQLENAWRLFKQGRLAARRQLSEMERSAKTAQAGGIGPYSYQHLSADDPLWDIDKERILAVKRLKILSWQEQNMFVSRSTMVKIHRGEVPNFHKSTIMRVLDHKPVRVRPVPKARHGYQVVDQYWVGDTEHRVLKKTSTIVRTISKSHQDRVKRRPADEPEPSE